MNRIINIEDIIEHLKQYEKMCDDINALFGLNVSVKFNPILSKVYDRYMTDPEPEQPNDPKQDDEQSENVSRETNDETETKDGETNEQDN